MSRQVAYCITLLAFTLFARSYNHLSANLVIAENAAGLKATFITGEDNTIPLVANVAQQGSITASSVGDCFLSPLQYSFFVAGEGTCHLPFLGAGVKVTGDQNLKLYIRYGQRVEVEGNRIVADYVSESASHDEGMDIFAWSMPPLRGGTYFIALGNCGPDKVNYEIYAVFFGIDFAGPVIFRAEVVGEKLLVYGLFDDSGGELLVNGKRQKQVIHDEQEPGCILIANKTGKKIEPGEKVTLRVRFPSGYVTPKFKFTRPLQ
jgi:hypothetical protein